MTSATTPAEQEWIRRGILELEFYANKAIHEAASESGHVTNVNLAIECVACGGVNGHSSSCDAGPGE